MNATRVLTDAGPRGLPRALTHALAQLRRRRFHLIPAGPGAPASPRRRYPVSLGRRLLLALPDSPALKQCLAAVPPRTEAFAGHVWLGPDQRPRIALDGLGVWELALPGRRATYAELRELRTPQDVRPVASHVIEIAPGIVERRHRIPLRYHPGAWLMVAVTAWPKGGVRYDAWLWHAGRRRALALWWEESQRVTDLFRDCAASWFWVGPPPDSAKPPDSEPGAVPTARAEEDRTRE